MTGEIRKLLTIKRYRHNSKIPWTVDVRGVKQVIAPKALLEEIQEKEKEAGASTVKTPMIHRIKAKFVIGSTMMMSVDLLDMIAPIVVVRET